MLLARLYGKNIGSTIRSAQCVCVVAMVVVVALGFTAYVIMWSARALPAQSHMLPPVGGYIMMGVTVVGLGLLTLWWRARMRAIREDAVAALAKDVGQDGLFEDVISRWATQRVRFVRPIVATAIVALLGAAATLSVPTLVLSTVPIVGLCVRLFPTKKRVFAFLRDVVAAGVINESDVDQNLSKAVELYICDPSRPHPWQDAARVTQHFGRVDGPALAQAAEAIVKEVARKVAPDWSRTTIEVHLFEVARYLRREYPELSKAAIEAIVWSESYAHK